MAPSRRAVKKLWPFEVNVSFVVSNRTPPMLSLTILLPLDTRPWRSMLTAVSIAQFACIAGMSSELGTYVETTGDEEEDNEGEDEEEEEEGQEFWPFPLL